MQSDFSRDPTTHDASYLSVRAALALAIATDSAVRLLLHDDSGGRARHRSIDGVPYEVSVGPDARERVFVRIAESTEQIVLVERIADVLLDE